MKVSTETIKDTTLIKVDNECGLKMTFCSFGAGVYSLMFDNRRMILEPKTLDDYKFSTQFFGKTVGVVAGRIKKEGILFGNPYSLESEAGSNLCLHGGNLKSISFKNRKYKIKESNKKVDVSFNIKTRSGENGFPGGANIYVIYSISKEKNEFKITHKASTPKEATLLSLTNHMYFNLDDNDVSNHRLKMNSSIIAVTDENLYIYSSEHVSDAYNFSKSVKLNSRLAYVEKKNFKGTFDDCFKFDDNCGKVILSNKDIQLNIQTDYPAINIYVDNTNSDMKFNNENIFPLRRGIALETEKWLLDHNSIILKHEQQYKHSTIYKFKKKS